MTNKKVFAGMEFPTFYHPDCKEDEVFMQYIGEEERSAETPWKTIRFGEAEINENDSNRKIYPIFVKKQEIVDAGGILVPVRDDLKNQRRK